MVTRFNQPLTVSSLVTISPGLDNYTPYIDDRPPLAAGKPETRQYRARYILRDQATGEWSDIVTATFVP